ncbi:MAG: hypothetical protein JWR72_1253 [Flavisolibacter sp.]|nr:hypothetical protein [Flavisolibacter sp.]
MRTPLICVLLFPLAALCQKIDENKVDELTKASVKRTTWEKVCNSSFSKKFTAYARVSKVDSTLYLGFKAMTGKELSVKEGDEFTLITKGDSITLHSLKSVTSCKGCGSQGFGGSGVEGINLAFIVPAKQAAYLKNNPVQKIRLYTSIGYIEDELNEKNAKTLMKEFELIQ